MTKVFRCLTVLTISVAFAAASTALAQTYTTVDFPGAIATTLDGGPNPEGTNISTWTDTAGFTHGFVLKDGAFTSFDVPGSTATTPNWISPQGVIVGGYVDSRGANHGFVLDNGQYTTVDFPSAAGTILTGLNPSGEMAGASCTVASCPATSLHSFTVSKQGVFKGFDPPGAISSNAASINPSGAVVGAYRDSSGVGHGYLLYHGTFTTIDFPGATFTFAGANNPSGVIVGLWTDTSGRQSLLRAESRSFHVVRLPRSRLD
jgi:hypothetical protein